MKLAYSSNGFTRVDLLAAIRGIAASGYAGIELLADVPHWRPVDNTPARLADLRRALGDAGLSVSNVNANTAVGLWPAPPPEQVFEPSLSHHDPAVRRRRIDYTFAALDLAAAVGAPCVSVSSGRTESGVPPALGLEYFTESVVTICERAASLGLRVGIEYEPALLVESAREVQAVWAAAGHPALGVNLDVGHAWCAGEDPGETIRALAGRIWNLHVEDIRDRKHYHLVPGEGNLDFAGVFDALRDVGYGGFVTVELYTCAAFADDAAARAFRHLAPLAAEVRV